jgi:hypothetical protein
MTSENKHVVNAASTDQHITGEPETGEFTTDRAPTSGTPAHGSSNVGVNTTDANRPGAMDEADGGHAPAKE